MKQSVLMTSGFPDEVIRDMSRRWRVVTIPSQAEALAYLKACPELPIATVIGVVALSPVKTDLDARRMLREIHKLDADLPVVISAHAQSARLIVDFIKQGAFDYVIEPPDYPHEDWRSYINDLMIVMNHAISWREVTLENRRLRTGLSGLEEIRGRSAGTARVIELARKVAPTPATVLVSGESGTGKELVARAIHSLSVNKEAPFTAVNCGAIEETLLASELFGHVKGAFTGAETNRAGLMRETGAGTLFLDEIGTVGPGFQVKLLRALEQRTARPVGGSEEYKVTCRFVSAANADLETLVRRGKFREDLFYRLNVFHIHVPPLRERREDIAVLADYFLRQTARQFGKQVTGISPEAMELLEAYHWPGNVRELRNAVERAVILCEGERIEIRDLDPSVRQSEAIDTAGSYVQAMRRFERGLIRSALERAGGNQSEAARLLSMGRLRLAYRIRQLEMEGKNEERKKKKKKRNIE